MGTAAQLQRSKDLVRNGTDRPRIIGGAPEQPPGTFYPEGLDVLYGISDGTPPAVSEAFPGTASVGARLLRRSKLETLLGS